jgi:cellobiose-specific phosphotransferase system component IIC
MTFLLYRVVLFMQQPEGTELNGIIYLTPFKWQLWTAMMATMLLLAFSLSVCFYTASRYAKTEHQDYSLLQSLFSTFACFCAQGNN